MIARDAAFYTGSFRAREKDTRLVQNSGGILRFEITVPLAPREGTTVEVWLPKGALPPPDAGQERQWFLCDHSPPLRYSRHLPRYLSPVCSCGYGAAVIRYAESSLPRGVECGDDAGGLAKGLVPDPSQALALVLALVEVARNGRFARTNGDLPVDLAHDLRLVLDHLDTAGGASCVCARQM